MQLQRTRESAAGLASETMAQLGSAAGTAVAQSLQACGLSGGAADKVACTIELQVKVVLQDASN